MLKRYGNLVFVFFLFLFQHPTYASQTFSSPITVATVEQISIETERNVLLKNRLQLLQQRAKQPVTKIDTETLHQLDLTVTLIKEDLRGIQLTLAAAQQANDSTLDYIQVLQSQLQNNRILSNIEGNILSRFQSQLHAQLAEQKALYSLQIKRIGVLQAAQTLVMQTLDVTQRWKNHLSVDYQIQQALQRQTALANLAASLQQAQQAWLAKLADLNKQLTKINATDFLSNPIYVRLQVEILEAEEKGNLAQFELDLSRMRNSLENLISMAEYVHSVSDLNEVKQRISLIEKNLDAMVATFDQKIDLLKSRHQVFKYSLQNNFSEVSPGVVAIINALITDYTARQKTAVTLMDQAKNVHNIIVEKSTRQLTQRQPLPNFNYSTLVELGQQLKSIFSLMKQKIILSCDAVIVAVKKLKHWQIASMSLLLFLWIAIGFKFKRTYLDLIVNNVIKKNLYVTNLVLLTSMRLLKRHLFGIMLLVGLCGFLYLLAIPFEIFILMICLSAIVLIFRISISLAYLILMANSNPEKNNSSFYFHLRWILIVGGAISILTFIVQALPVAYSVQDLFGRLFMLFLMIMAIVLFRGWIKSSVLLLPYVQNKKHYLKKIIRWLTFLIPFGIFSNALIGILGYVTFAWSMAIYQGAFLIVLTSFLLIDGLLGELLQLIVEKLILHDYDGVFWYEMLFKPLYWLLKIVLLWYGAVVFFHLCGWDQQTWVVTKIIQILNLKLFTLGNSAITAINILQLIAIVLIFIWVARWTRELAHRCIFAEIKDSGLRNSLVVFSQYTMIVLGVIIALHISGIDLTALTVVMSVFAAGIGFGLRDLANNFISGVLLLIERPVNIGDYVTLAGHEGTVKHIGMRSITVITNDNQALLVPNSQVYSQAFMNWSRCNGTVRSSVTLRINRVDDPHHVKAMIHDVLKNLPNILNTPSAEIELNQLDKALLEFQVGYYLDMSKITTLSSVRSVVLYAIWDRFKEEGIHSPEVVNVISMQDEKKGGNV